MNWLERYRVGLFVAVVAVVLAGLGALRLLKPAPSPLSLDTVTPPPSSSPEATPTPRQNHSCCVAWFTS